MAMHFEIPSDTASTAASDHEDLRSTGSKQNADTCADDALETNLAHFRPALDSFASLPPGNFTKIRMLATGINGNIYVCSQERGDKKNELVAVKEIGHERLQMLSGTETDERMVHFQVSGARPTPTDEDALTEIGVLSFLSRQPDLPQYLLRTLGVFSHDTAVWLVTELAEGGELYAQIEQHGPLSLGQSSTFSWQILQAISYLHRHHIGHRDISLENVLLKNGSVRVMDYGMAARSSSATGTALRYFRPLGKAYYRAPECNLPSSLEVEVMTPADATPGEVVVAVVGGKHICEAKLPAEAVPNELCWAEVWGYALAPADVWSVGVCIFIMLVGSPAWEKAVASDVLFAYAREHGLAKLLRRCGMPVLPGTVQTLLDNMLESRPANRLSAKECLAASWFAGKARAAVPLHPKVADDACTALPLFAGA